MNGMTLPVFVVSATPVMVMETRQFKKSIRIMTHSAVDTPPEVSRSTLHDPVYFKIKYEKKYRKKTKTKTAKEEASLEFSHPDATLNFPFLCERQTRSLIQRSKVLFIMRGLPGSGKSTIVNTITGTYPSSVVCSADDYFLEDGVYRFDAASLGSAHAACQQKAKDACNAGVPVVIVDNTNVKRWEMKYYLELAGRTDYVVVPVQPKTPWRWNPEELAARNKHGVDVEILKRKVDQFDDAIPVYYAWFLPESSSRQLTSITECLLEECVQLFSGFTDRLLKQLHISPTEYRHWQRSFDADSSSADTFSGLFKRYYTKRNRAGCMVHCTAKFCGSGRAVGAKTYHALPVVQNSLGESFTLTIHSVCFSPRTVGARVQLHENQLLLFDKPEEKDWNGVQSHWSPAKSSGSAREATNSARPENGPHGQSKHPKGGRKKAAKSKQKNDSCEVSSQQKNDSCYVSVDDNQSCSPMMTDFRPKCTKPVAKVHGRSAHITVGCAEGFESRETNFDVLRLCDMEASTGVVDADFVTVTGGKARYFGDGVCCVYFDPPLYVKTIYSGYY